MTKILNTAALLKEERIVTIAGENHIVKDMSVGDFIKINDLAEKADKIQAPTVSQRVLFLVDVVLISLPTCTKESLLKSCTYDELNVIAEFIKNGTLPDDVNVEIEDSNEAVEKKSKTVKRT